jgi:CubicO group peptidase (beta-lactamase class C family)
MPGTETRDVPLLRVVCVGLLMAFAMAAGASSASAQSARAKIDALMRDAVAQHGVRAAIVQVKVAGRPVLTQAYGQSTPGVPATTRMRFRNGTVATAYLSTLLLRLADEGKVDLGDRLSKWLPDVRGARRVTLRMLAAMTAGYHDYATDPRMTDLRYANPFGVISTRDQLRLALERPLQFAPGSNWSYSHSNYVLLGRALSRITGMPLAVALRRMVLRPLGLRDTRAASDATMPRPALDAYSSERRAFLGIPAGTPFIEDSTLWNPSWIFARGAVQTTTIADLSRTAIAIGTGRLLSRRAHRLQIAPHVGFGHPAPGCDRCTRLSRRYGFGLGVARNGSWIEQRSLFSGYGAVASYLPSKRISIALVTTFRASSHDDQGNLSSYWTRLHAKLARVMAPGSSPLAGRSGPPPEAAL